MVVCAAALHTRLLVYLLWFKGGVMDLGYAAEHPQALFLHWVPGCYSTVTTAVLKSLFEKHNGASDRRETITTNSPAQSQQWITVKSDHIHKLHILFY